MGTPRTMRSARWKREANSLIFSHVAVSTGVIGSPETPLYLALIASKSNSGRRSCQISNVSTKRLPARSLYSERKASTIAADADFSFRGETTMFKTCIFHSFSCKICNPQAGIRQLVRMCLVEVAKGSGGAHRPRRRGRQLVHCQSAGSQR